MPLNPPNPLQILPELVQNKRGTEEMERTQQYTQHCNDRKCQTGCAASASQSDCRDIYTSRRWRDHWATHTRRERMKARGGTRQC